MKINSSFYSLKRYARSLFVLALILAPLSFPPLLSGVYGQTAENMAAKRNTAVPALIVKTNTKTEDLEACRRKINAIAKEHGVFHPGGDAEHLSFFIVTPNKTEIQLENVEKALLAAFPSAEIRRTTSDKMSAELSKMIGK